MASCRTARQRGAHFCRRAKKEECGFAQKLTAVGGSTDSGPEDAAAAFSSVTSANGGRTGDNLTTATDCPELTGAQEDKSALGLMPCQNPVSYPVSRVHPPRSAHSFASKSMARSIDLYSR